jgi:CRP/FNR family transcriptional regulator, cyclic AMP receptor protein
MVAVDVLKASPLFKGFTDTGLQILSGIAIERAFPAGTPLFVENMVADTLLLIAEGEVRLSARGPGGEDHALGEVGAGGALGQIALIHAGQRLCTATATSNVTALELRQADFQKLMAQKPQACVKLLMNIIADFGQRLGDNRESLRSLLGRK